MIFDFLESNSIAFQRVDHPAVFTCEEADRLVPVLPGAKTKNLFLCDGKGRRHFLLSVRPEKAVDLKLLGEQLSAAGLRLASAERLDKHLKLNPGSVTLLGLINDRQHAVELVIDQELWQEESFLCHPLVNTSTLVIEKAELDRIFKLTGHLPRIIDVPLRSSC